MATGGQPNTPATLALAGLAAGTILTILGYPGAAMLAAVPAILVGLAKVINAGRRVPME